MDVPFYMVVAALVLVAITASLELLLQFLWVPVYFRHGIPVFRRKVRLDHERLFAAQVLAQEYYVYRPYQGVSPLALYSPEVPVRFWRLDEHHIAFRAPPYMREMTGFVFPLTRGLLSQSDPTGTVTVHGYLNWTALAFGFFALFVLIGFPNVWVYLLLFLFMFFHSWAYVPEWRQFENLVQLLESHDPGSETPAFESHRPRSRGPAFDIAIAPGDIQADAWHGGHYGYTYEGRGVLITQADSDQSARTSRLVVLEDMQPLGPAHAPLADVERLGMGRFCHWRDGTKCYLRFSTSDNSDPRMNGRKYMVAIGKHGS